MTGRELIQWILYNKLENSEAEVQYRNKEMSYTGTDKTLYLIDETAKDSSGWTYSRIVL